MTKKMTRARFIRYCLRVPMKGRRRVVETEPCLQCGARMGRPCSTYRMNKWPCIVTDMCPRCAAQRGQCVHATRPLRQGELFGEGVSYG